MELRARVEEKPEEEDPPGSPGSPGSAAQVDPEAVVVVEVVRRDGVCGMGLTKGGEAVCHLVELVLAPCIEGSDARAIESSWERMWHATHAYGRTSRVALCAISGVDLALWDALGKAFPTPHSLRGLPLTWCSHCVIAQFQHVLAPHPLGSTSLT